MNKSEFLAELKKNLAGIPEEDIEKSLDFYSEMIDDRLEDGLTEEEAVAALGSIDEIRAQIVKDTPITKIIKEKVKPKRMLSGLEIVLLIVGFPIWFPLLVAAASVLLAVYVVMWSVIIVLYSAVLCFFVGALAGIFGSIPMIFMGNASAVLLTLGSGLICAGLGILWIFLCVGATNGVIWLTKVFIKSLFMRKGDR